MGAKVYFSKKIALSTKHQSRVKADMHFIFDLSNPRHNFYRFFKKKEIVF